MSEKEFKKIHKAYQKVISHMYDYKRYGGDVNSIYYQQLMDKAETYFNKLSPEIADKRFEAIFFNHKKIDQKINEVQRKVASVRGEQKNHADQMKEQMRQFVDKVVGELNRKDRVLAAKVEQVLDRMLDLEVHSLQNTDRIEKIEKAEEAKRLSDEKLITGLSTVAAFKKFFAEINPRTWKGRVELQNKLIYWLFGIGLGYMIYELINLGKKNDLIYVNSSFNTLEDLRNRVDIQILELSESPELEQEFKRINEKFNEEKQRVDEFNSAHELGDERYIGVGLSLAHKHRHSSRELDVAGTVAVGLSPESKPLVQAKVGFQKEAASLVVELKKINVELVALEAKILVEKNKISNKE
ncbi:MAG: hypothetical protein ACXVAJ_01940 [Parachlamydiaceae bacterium]